MNLMDTATNKALKILTEKEMKNLASIRHMNHMEVLLLRKANQLMRYDRADIRKVGISLAKKMIQPNLTFNKSATDLKKQYETAYRKQAEKSKA
jgi:hypothetical protein